MPNYAYTPILLLCGPPPPSTTPDCLIDAAVAWLQTNCGMLVNYIGTGLAPPGVDLPYILLAENLENRRTADQGRNYVDSGTIEISTFNAGKSITRSIAKAIANSLNDAPLIYQDGYLMELRQKSRPLVIQDPIDFARGSNVWQEVRSFAYRSGGNYSGTE